MKTAKAPLDALYRFDYVKFTFRDAHPDLSQQRFMKALTAVNKFCSEMLPGTWREPKQTFLDPAQSRPNGLHIIEIWGIAANAVVSLPWAWVEYLTFAHVKTYVDLQGNTTYDELLHLFDTPGFRKGTRITPRRQRHSVKDSSRPGLQLGSKKSDLHFGIYVRPGEKVGVEARFRDERLATARDNACLAVGEPTSRAKGGWVVLLRQLASVGRNQLDYEFLSRDAEVDDYFAVESYGTARLSPWATRFHGHAAFVPEPEPEPGQGEYHDPEVYDDPEGRE